MDLPIKQSAIDLQHIDSLMRSFDDVESEFRVVKTKGACCVIESNDYFFKIRRIDLNDPCLTFEEKIRQAFAQEYRKMGIDWNCLMLENSGDYYSVQRRQKLVVLKNQGADLDHAMKIFSNIKHRVENKLEFPNLYSQVNRNHAFSKTKKIVLARISDDGAEDYAVFDGGVVSLGDSGWFIAFLNEADEWDEELHYADVEVKLSYGDFYFTGLEVINQDRTAIGRLFDVINKWWLFPMSNFDITNTRSFLSEELKKMYNINLEMAVSKQLKDVKTNKDYTNMLEESKRLQGYDNGNLPKMIKERKVDDNNL